jgi:hypothetical protein
VNETESPAPRRRRGGTAALVAGGLLAGGVLGATVSATAATSPPAAESTPAPDAGAPDAPAREGCGRPDETPLEGDVAAEVEAAALERYPGATILRVETDADGVYEAHLVTTDGRRVTVEVGEDFTVTGEEAARPGGPHHGSGRPGGAPDERPDAGTGAEGGSAS